MWSGRRDLNPRPYRPERYALPSCATPRPEARAFEPRHHSSGSAARDMRPRISEPRNRRERLTLAIAMHPAHESRWILRSERIAHP